MSAGPWRPPSANSRPSIGADTSAIAASARTSRRPRSGASDTGRSANGASLNHPAAASIPVHKVGRRQRSTAIASIAASTTSDVPVDTVISSDGNASQASAARSPASSTSTALRRTAPPARTRGRPEHGPTGDERREHRDGEPTVDRVPHGVHGSHERQRRVQRVAENWIGVTVDDPRRHVSVGKDAVDQPRRALHDRVDHVDGVGRAHPDHHVHERDDDQRTAQPAHAPRWIQPRRERVEQRPRRSRLRAPAQAL